MIFLAIFVPKSTASSAQMAGEKEHALLALTQASPVFDVVVPLVSSIHQAITKLKQIYRHR